jgi:phospholipid/cholesterol/gamma-HCH transport system substrate-binding protein
VATIQTDGLVGNKFLQVDAGTSSGAEVKDGSMIQSREPFEFGDLMQEVSDTVKSVNQTVTDVKSEFDDTFKAVADTAKTASDMISNASDDVKEISANGRKISDDISSIVDGVRAGRGTVGKLFTDDQLYKTLRASVDEIEGTAANIRKTSDDVQSMVNDLKSRDVMKNVDETLANVKDVSARARKVISDFQPDEGNGLSADLRQTLAGAKETMEDFSENSEALKRSWFFRGFFKQRGFYDLDSISMQDYKDGKAAPGYPQKRAWLTAYELFTANTNGTENLTDEGKRAIDRAMAEFLPYAKDQPIMVEGYAGEGTAGDQFVRSHDRAHLVRDYLLKRYFLKTNYVGVMQMGAVASPQGQQGSYKGISLVLFSPKAPEKTK